MAGKREAILRELEFQLLGTGPAADTAVECAGNQWQAAGLDMQDFAEMLSMREQRLVDPLPFLDSEVERLNFSLVMRHGR